MKRNILFLFFILLFIFFPLVFAQNLQDPSSIISGVEFDSNTGLPKSFNEFEKNIDALQKQEQDQSYFQKEWGIILGKTPIIGPFLFYLERFFSLFNFLWKASFGIEFSWSLAFFTHVFIWGILIFVVFFPAQEFFKNKIFALITGFVVATISGLFNVIPLFAGLLEASLRTFFSYGIFFILTIVLLVLYDRLFASLKKSSQEEMLERSKMETIAFGDVIRNFFRKSKNP